MLLERFLNARREAIARFDVPPSIPSPWPPPPAPVEDAPADSTEDDIAELVRQNAVLQQSCDQFEARNAEVEKQFDELVDYAKQQKAAADELETALRAAEAECAALRPLAEAAEIYAKALSLPGMPGFASVKTLLQLAYPPDLNRHLAEDAQRALTDHAAIINAAYDLIKRSARESGAERRETGDPA
jgi:hypothetical protein